MNRPPALALAAFFTVCIVWGTTFLGIRVAVESMPPVLLTGIRYTVAGLVMIALLHLRGERIPRDPRTLRDIAIVAVLLIGGGTLALVYAEQWVPSGTAALLMATEPFWAAILDALRRDGERIRLRRTIGMVIGFGGVALLVTPGSATAAFGPRFLLGALLIQVSAMAWQGGSVYTKHALKHVPPLMSAALQALIGGVLLDLAGLAIGDAQRFHPTNRSLLALAYLTVFGTLVGYTAYTYALAHIRMSVISLYAYATPIVAVLLGWLVLGERLTWLSITAMAVILAGVALVQFGERRRRSVPPQTSAVCSLAPRRRGTTMSA
jgi:drug/metabolite transporter (DMT)-like permease